MNVLITLISVVGSICSCGYGTTSGFGFPVAPVIDEKYLLSGVLKKSSVEKQKHHNYPLSFIYTNNSYE